MATAVPEGDSSSIMVDKYVYEDLPAPGVEEQDIHIRLITLEPTQNTDDITCTMSVHPLASSDSLGFQAVSYSWGHYKDKCQIQCDGMLVTIPNNLKDFLVRTQTMAKTNRTLWIDSICINQGNAEEKNSQVTAMRHIYKKAKQTLIWLGKESEDSTLGLTFASECCEAYRKKLSGEEDATTTLKKPWYQLRAYEEYSTVFDSKWGAFFHIFDRPYWTRAWVVQEVVVSKQQWIVCGKKAIPWDTLYTAYLYIMTYESWVIEFYGSSNINQLMAMQVSQYEVNNHVKPAHYKVLLRHRGSMATDARDKIFAYYGISAHHSLTEHEITPDYSKSTREIYTNIAVSTLRGATDLEYLDVPRLTRDNDLGLPSWVTDWTSTSSTTQFSLRLLEFEIAGVETQDKFIGATKGSTYTAVIDKTLTRLELCGYTIDRIAKVTNAWVVQDTSGYSSIRKQARVLQKNQGYMHEWETVLGLASKTPYHTGESRMDVLLQTCVAGIHPTGKDETRKLYLSLEKRQFWLRNIQRLGLSTFILPWIFVVLVGHLLRGFGIPNPEIGYRNLVAGMINRRALVTLKGYVGMVPGIAEVGDYIVLAKGGRMPLVLRPKGKDWEFIGDCYIHGVMNGELWDEDEDEQADKKEGKKSRCESIVLV